MLQIVRVLWGSCLKLMQQHSSVIDGAVGMGIAAQDTCL
jgi:hypothetical protein